MRTYVDAVAGPPVCPRRRDAGRPGRPRRSAAPAVARLEKAARIARARPCAIALARELQWRRAMSRNVIWGALGAAALGALSWQNHSASQRVARLAERVDVLAESARAPRFVPVPPAAAVRDIVVAPAVDRPAPTPPRPATQEALPEEPPVDPARREAAQRHADEILGSGVLTADDSRRLGRELDVLPRAEAFQIRRRIAHAINTQRLVPTETPFEMP